MKQRPLNGAHPWNVVTTKSYAGFSAENRFYGGRRIYFNYSGNSQPRAFFTEKTGACGWKLVNFVLVFLVSRVIISTAETMMSCKRVYRHCPAEVVPSVNIQIKVRVPVRFESVKPFNTVAVVVPEAGYDWNGLFLDQKLPDHTFEDVLQVNTPLGCDTYTVYSSLSNDRVAFEFTAFVDVAAGAGDGKGLGNQIVAIAKILLPALLKIRGPPGVTDALSSFTVRTQHSALVLKRDPDGH